MDLSPNLSPSARLLAGHYRRPRLSAGSVTLAVLALDIVTLGFGAWFALFAAAAARFEAVPAAAVALSLALCGTAIVAIAGGYRLREMRRGMACAATILVAATVPIAILGLWGDPLTLTGAAVVAALLGPVPARIAIAAWLRWASESGLMERRVVLIGGGAPARELIERIASRPETDLRVCAIFDDRSGERSPDLVLDVPRIGRFEDLIGFVAAAEIDLVVITMPTASEQKIGWLLDLISTVPVPVHMATFSDDLAFANGLRQLARGTYGPRVRLTKRLFDLVIGTAALLVLSPVMVVAAVAIRLDNPGPILFRQWRTGFAGRPVEVLKFRTMRAEDADPAACKVVLRGDARVTRVGRYLRRSSIDELPQLLNVLHGDLSLVGPRPHAIDALSARHEAFDALVTGYGRRHRLPPGLTGWAQIHGLRGTVEQADHLRARVEHDLWYIENWSPWLDFAILLRTPFCLFRTANAF